MGAEVIIAEPFKACSSLANAEELKHRIAVIERGECMFIDKVQKISNNRVRETLGIYLEWPGKLLYASPGITL